MAGNTQVLYRRRLVDIDKLLRKYTPTLRKKIDPTDIFNDLLDLTTSDREQIRCRTRQEGDIRGMDKLLECIGRRPRKCFFDFLVLLENNGYSEKSDFIIKREELNDSPELSEAREQYIRNGEGVEIVPRQNEKDIIDDMRYHQDMSIVKPLCIHNTPTGRMCNPVLNQMMPTATANKPSIPHHADRNPHQLHRMESDPCEMMRFDPGFRGNGHHSNNPVRPGENVNTFLQNPEQYGQGVERIPRYGSDSQIKSKDDFVIDLNQTDQTCAQINQENNGSQKPCHQPQTVYSRAHVSTSHYPQVQTNPNSPQRIGADRLDTGRMRGGQNKNQTPLQNTLVMQTDQRVSLPHQQGAPAGNAQDDRLIDDLTDEVFNNLVVALSDDGESPVWKKVGQKAGIKRGDMRRIVACDSSEKPAEVMLNMLNDKYKLTIPKLSDILRQIRCFEALQILEGTVELHRNIDVSDDENVKINNLGHLDGGYPPPKDDSSDFNTTSSSENTGSFFEKQSSEKVIENISAPFYRQPQEHEHLKCEAHQEIVPTMSEDCSQDMKSVQPSEINLSGDKNQNQGERIVEPVEAKTDQENKNTGMDVTGLSGDISANLRGGDVGDESFPIISTVSSISNKMQNLNIDSTQDNERKEFPVELSGVQAQEDANYSHSEKPPCQEIVQLQQEIQTQPNISSFRDLQHSIPAHQREGVSTLSVSGPARTINSDHQSFEEEHEKDVKYADMNLECTANDKLTLSKIKNSDEGSVVEKQFIGSNPGPGLTSEEMSVSEMGESESFFNNKAVFNTHATPMSNRDVSVFKAEGDENFKQSVLPPDMENKNFQREIETQQHPSEDCRGQTQQITATTSDLQAPQGETEFSIHTGSFRDVQNSVPEYRSQDLGNPNSSLPRNVDSLVMDEDETFLKEKNQPL